MSYLRHIGEELKQIEAEINAARIEEHRQNQREEYERGEIESAACYQQEVRFGVTR
jgi:hypothetical protein